MPADLFDKWRSGPYVTFEKAQLKNKNKLFIFLLAEHHSHVVQLSNKIYVSE